MAFEDGFKDTVIIFPVFIRDGRNDANNPEYRPEDVIKNVPCRIRKVSENEIKIFFKKTQIISKGDCVFSINGKEMYIVDFIKLVYGKKELHHKTILVTHSPHLASLMEMIADE